MLQNLRLYFLIFIFFLLTAGIFFVFNLYNKQEENRQSFATVVAAKPQLDLTKKQTYHGLPVAYIASYPVANAKGTVIFIPQYHKSPGSDVNATINDAGAQTQEEMYTILHFLIKQAGIDFVMTEGNLYGEVPVEKIALLADKIEKRNELQKIFSGLKEKLQSKQISSTEKNFIQSLTSEISTIDRAIVLEGAAEKLKAEGNLDFTLLGSENEQTREESKRILQEYLFLKNRIAQLSDVSEKVTTSSSLIPQQTSALITALLKKSSQPQFVELQQQLIDEEETDTARLVQNVANAYSNVKKTPDHIIVAASKDTPTMDDNPYKEEVDMQYLQNKMDNTKKQVETIIIKKRNKETAENFVKALHHKKTSIGILEFGAGHEKGMIEELQKQGLTVIVVTPQEVARRENN